MFSSMSYDLSILRAMLRLARKREAAGVGALLDRAGGDAAGVRAALRRLEQQGMVERQDAERARLTFVGFAVAYATRGAPATSSLAARSRRPRARHRAA
jgi:DNA-binding IclR family transcriptional regulator